MDPPRADSPEDAAAALGALYPAVLRLVLGRLEQRRHADTPEGRLSPEQQLTLLTLRDGPLGVSEVAQGTGVAVSTSTRMLQGLARMGLVEAEPAGDDRRRRNTRLTDEGRRILEASLALRDARFTALIAPLSDRDRAALVDGVRALTRALSMAEDTERPAPGAHPGE